jgi:cbb3-type cytochrome oxidase maturation protein
MEILVVLLPLALGLGGIFLLFFLWSVKKGQYDDVETPKYRMLLDETKVPNELQKRIEK